MLACAMLSAPFRRTAVGVRAAVGIAQITLGLLVSLILKARRVVRSLLTPPAGTPVAVPVAASATPWRHAALCVGFDYPGTSLALSGCQADAEVFARMLARDGCDPTLLIDRPSFRNLEGAGRADEIRVEFARLAREAREAFDRDGTRTAIVFTYSGHGARFDDGMPRFERDGVDEALVAPDRPIPDDELREWLANFGAEARVVLVLDCCHSGTAADLAFGATDAGVTREHLGAPLRAEVICLAGTRDLGYTFEVKNDAGNYRGAFSVALQTASMRFWDGGAASRMSPRALLASVAQITAARVSHIDDVRQGIDQTPRVTASREELIDDTRAFAPWLLST